MQNIIKLSTSIARTPLSLRYISCTTVRCIDQKWREEKGLPDNPNEFGPLTNLPDYTFLDGRPTPMGSNQKRRLIRQKEIATKIVEMNSELAFAKQRHARQTAEKLAEKQRILDNKLKPKGHLLLQKK